MNVFLASLCSKKASKLACLSIAASLFVSSASAQQAVDFTGTSFYRWELAIPTNFHLSLYKDGFIPGDPILANNPSGYLLFVPGYGEILMTGTSSKNIDSVSGSYLGVGLKAGESVTFKFLNAPVSYQGGGTNAASGMAAYNVTGTASKTGTYGDTLTFTSTGVDSLIFIQDVALNRGVAIPEPASAMLISCAGMFLLLRRRRAPNTPILIK